jgi:predicted  nucleic acid-binding Zn-ribbon protein
MLDTVQVKCTRCKTVFRERAKRMQSGYSRQCPCCEVVLFFEEDTQDVNMKKAMRNARHVRRELRELEAAGAMSSAPGGMSRRHGGRGRSEARAEEDAE